MSSRSCSAALRCFFVCQAKPGHDLPHHSVADANVVGRLQPSTQVTQLGIRHGRYPFLQSIAERFEPERYVVVLRAGCRIVQLAQPCPCLGHIRLAHAKSLRQHRQRGVRMGQHPVA